MEPGQSLTVTQQRSFLLGRQTAWSIFEKSVRQGDDISVHRRKYSFHAHAEAKRARHCKKDREEREQIDHHREVATELRTQFAAEVEPLPGLETS